MKIIINGFSGTELYTIVSFMAHPTAAGLALNTKREYDLYLEEDEYVLRVYHHDQVIKHKVQAVDFTKMELKIRDKTYQFKIIE